jgi:hypothetical protein
MFAKVIFCFLLFSLPLSAQVKFNAGLSFGPIKSGIPGIISYKNSKKTGINAGLIGTATLDGNSFLQIEINYTQKGCRSGLMLNNSFYRLSLNYAEIPVLYRFDHDRGYIEAGVSYCRLLDFEEMQDFYVVHWIDPQLVRETDISLLGGGGWFLGDYFAVGARYGWSALPIFRRTSVTRGLAGSYGLKTGRNITLQVTLKYMIKAEWKEKF